MITNRCYGVEIEAIAASAVVINHIIRDLVLAGIECNTESYNHTARPHWKVVGDGSVHGKAGEYGFELVSPKLAGENGLAQIRTVCEILARYGVKVNKTCGLHVHHDAADYKAKHFEQLFTLYAKSEKALDSVVAASRRGSANYFCQSVVGKDIINVRSCRYHKLNLAAFHRHGTVEVRHHQGTVDAEKIIAWVLLTQGLVERAKCKVKADNHSLSLYDVLQAAGIIHAAKTNMLAASVRDYFNERRRHFAAAPAAVAA